MTRFGRGWRAACGRKTCAWASKPFVDRYEARAALSKHLDYEHRRKAWLAAGVPPEVAWDADGCAEAEADAGERRARAPRTAAEPTGAPYAPRHAAGGSH